ncbi:hypothetical protein YB2330_003924 [Saitoella coloradoensis]
MARLFDNFPLVQHPPALLPATPNTPDHPDHPTLYIYSSSPHSPSFDAECLKWQTALLLAGVPFNAVSSNRHASPTSTLPFLNESLSGPLIHSSGIHTWIQNHPSANLSAYTDEKTQADASAFTSLIESKIHNAWIYTCFLEPKNYEAVALPRYTKATAWPVNLWVGRQIREEKRAEIEARRTVNGEEIYADAAAAFAAIAAALGDDDWFFASREPTLLDATLFTYTHLILSSPLVQDGIRQIVRTHGNLVKHAKRVYDRCYGRK